MKSCHGATKKKQGSFGIRQTRTHSSFCFVCFFSSLRPSSCYHHTAKLKHFQLPKDLENGGGKRKKKKNSQINLTGDWYKYFLYYRQLCVIQYNVNYYGFSDG